MYGYSGKFLRADLSSEKLTDETFDDSVLEKVVGGVGFGAYVLLREVTKDADPLGPDNKLIFSTGPLQATSLPGSAKWCVISKSPMNGYYGESAAGASWGVYLKSVGYDGVILEGQASRPVYLKISGDNMDILDAEKIWGSDSYEATDMIGSDLKDSGKNLSIVTIGQAGENGVNFASIVSDKHSFAGRSGMGAVMGSKRLKAIAVEEAGDTPEVARPEEVSELKKNLVSKVVKAGEGMRKHGTPGYMAVAEEYGDVPVKNWKRGSWSEGNEILSAPNYTEEILVKPEPCINCPLGCHRHVKIEDPDEYAMEGAGPEYETLAMIGENCLIDSLEAVAKANDLCNRYGVDTISTGSTLAFLMECQERSFLNDELTELDFSWGNPSTAIKYIKKLASREGIGDEAAQGILNLVRYVSSETKQFAVQGKGVDVPAHDPRAFYGISLNYATGVRGPGHERGNLQMPYQGSLLPEAGINKEPERYDMSNIGYLVAKYQDWSSLWNSLVICRFMSTGNMNFSDMLDMYNAVTGLDCSTQDFLKAGERIFNLQRMANVKFGVRRNDDEVPPRLLEPTEEGGHAGKAPGPMGSAIEDYYELRGWDQEGVPRNEILRRLDFNELLEKEILNKIGLK